MPERGLATPALCHRAAWGTRVASLPEHGRKEQTLRELGWGWTLQVAAGGQDIADVVFLVDWARPFLSSLAAVPPLGSGLQGRGWPSTAPFSPSLRSHVCHHHTAYVQGRVQLKRLGNTALLKAKCPHISREDKQSSWLHFFLPTARGYLRPHSAMLVGDRDQSCFLIVFIQWSKNAPDCSL